MDRRIWTAWVGSLGTAVLVGGCAAPPSESSEGTVASQEWDLKHGGVDGDGCPRHAHRITGTPGDDVLWGTQRGDCILGLGGDDEIHGRGGDDVVVGGDGDDLLYGDDDDDKIVGSAGADTIYGGGGHDLLLGGQGNDVLDGGKGHDWVAGGDCNDHLTGSHGPDVLLGEHGNDRIEAGNHQLIDGGKGTDACRGLRCEVRPDTAPCDDDADCRGGKHCVVSVGVCASEDNDDECGGGGNEECADGDCDDGNACNGDESCDASGMCVDGTAPAVDDGNVCTADTCSPASGVSNQPLPAGSSCADSDACNGEETCDGAGGCAPGSVPNPDDGNPCTVDGCDPATGVRHVPQPVGTSCGDGNDCNGVETCDGAGSCRMGNGAVVDDGNPCTADMCDPVTGVSNPPLPFGTSCADGNVCNGDEFCDGVGTCQLGAPLGMNDGNPCTADGCDPITGVSNEPVAAGTSCGNGNACDGNETCDGAGNCTPGSAPGVDDGNACTADSCSASGGVTHTPLSAGSSCSNGNACDGSETCDGAGGCMPGVPPDLDDDNACTADACNASGGVTHTPLFNTPCGGGNICRMDGSCGPGVCFGRPAGFSCSDGNACNGAETCSGTGVCNPGVPPIRC